jgi:three-Cys-motif partner protein
MASMARPSRATADGKEHCFGGEWTSTKLAVLAKYLTAYLDALKNQRFVTAYIDAFAGTGYRTMRREREEDAPGDLLFPDLATDEPQQLLDGSARLALKARGSGLEHAKPRFQRFIFIERSAERCRQLEGLKAEFPELANDIRVVQGDANAEIQQRCAKRWSGRRAVLFLDPYGMQVEWSTIEAIAKTKAIDLWLLFPLGIGVSRLLTRSGEIPKGWRMRLDKLLGTTTWYDEFYKVEHEAELFGNDEKRVVKATNETIARYFNRRLKTIFPENGVAEPGVLRNSSNNPLYLLCFAAGNDKGAPIAVKIANHLLKEVR